MKFNPFSALGAKIGFGLSAVLIAVIAVLLLTKNAEIRSLGRQNDKLTKDLVAARADLTQCRTNNAALSGAIDRQNGSIRAMEARAAEQAAAGAKDLAVIRQQGAQQTTKLNNVLNGQAKGSTACERAEYIVREATRP